MHFGKDNVCQTNTMEDVTTGQSKKVIESLVMIQIKAIRIPFETQ